MDVTNHFEKKNHFKIFFFYFCVAHKALSKLMCNSCFFVVAGQLFQTIIFFLNNCKQKTDRYVYSYFMLTDELKLPIELSQLTCFQLASHHNNYILKVQQQIVGIYHLPTNIELCDCIYLALQELQALRLKYNSRY